MLGFSYPGLALLTGSLLLINQANAQTFDLLVSHSGTEFFDGWTFEKGYDNTTNGDTEWSNEKSVAYLNDQGQAILKIANNTEVPWNEKRKSVRLSSNNWYKPGTVFVMDAVHVPVGCSVWPAWWTFGQNWPAGGEIDIFEPVNRDTINQMALHTTEGCTATSKSELNPWGEIGTNDCNQEANNGAGCTVRGGPAGEDFNNIGGGVYVMSFETTGINIWFLNRTQIPESMSATASSIDLSQLPNPIAAYSSSSCDINKFFSSQQMVLVITMCGDYAGVPSVLSRSCAALVGEETCYTKYVLDTASYIDAYFQINYINVYGSSDSIDPTISGKETPGKATTGTFVQTASVTSTTTAAPNATGNAARLCPRYSVLSIAFAMVLALMTLGS